MLRSPTALTFALLSLLTPTAAASDSMRTTKFSELPVRAQVRVSAALGSDLLEYHVRAIGNHYEAVNSRQELFTDFDASGVSIHIGSGHWKIVLRGFGYGDDIIPFHPIAPRAEGNRVEYQRGVLTEWYVNGPTGLEQCFTLRRRPGTAAQGRRLRIGLRLSGNLQARVQRDGNLSLMDRDGDVVLRYTALSVRDAIGRLLSASLRVERDQLWLEVDDSRAAYPILIDPTIQHFAFTASDGADNDQFGTSVATDGNTVVVGAYQAKQQTGAAYVFVRSKTGWTDMTQTAELTPSDPRMFDCFGCSVAISGNTIVVGASGATVGENNAQGAAYVFVKPPTGWVDMTQTARLTASNGAEGDELGSGVAISGGTVVAGAPDSNNVPGKAYVFVEQPGGWKDATEAAELLASDGVGGDDFGIAVSTNGTSILVGAPDRGDSRPGQAYVFVQPIGGWVNMTENAKLVASDGQINDVFGWSVSISGNIAVVGAPDHPNGGAVYVFVEPQDGWIDMTQTAKLESGAGVGCMGQTTAVDGKVIISGDQCSAGFKGAAFVFVKPALGWRDSSHPTLKLSIPFPNRGDYFGSSVAIDGKTAVVGAPYAPTTPPCHAGCQPGPGEAFVFTRK